MKTIENKTTTIPKGEGTTVSYADLFIALLNKPVQKMVSLKEMRRDIKLIDKLEDSTDTIELSDEDFTYLKGIVETSEWAVKHVDILDFADYIESLA
jgi:hypothetical protein